MDKESINSMFKFWLLCVAGAVLMLLLSDDVYLYWVNIQVPFLILYFYAVM